MLKLASACSTKRGQMPIPVLFWLLSPAALNPTDHLETASRPETWYLPTLTLPHFLSQTKLKPKRVKALYNCVADNPDELTFSEGDVIIVDGEEDQEWWVSRAGLSWETQGFQEQADL